VFVVRLKEEVFRMAIELADRVGACAVISMVDPPHNLPRWSDSLPLLVLKGGRTPPEKIHEGKPVYETVSDEWPDSVRKLLDTVDAVSNSATLSISSAVDMCILQKFIEVKGNYVVGITYTRSSYVVVLYNVKESTLLRIFEECSERVDAEILRNVINLAISMGCEGREGRRIGTTFIIGDTEEVMKRSYQLVLNPFEGHPKEHRLITDQQNWETIKGLAQLDGAFVIDEEGVIVSAGRYIDVDVKDVKLPKGFGGRHVSAAAITRETKAIAVTLSESGGEVRVFKDGDVVYETSPLQMGVYVPRKGDER
jgi:DNA integrity scanning protein DisA with diadenylate cyclase activity